MGRLVRITIYAIIILILYFWITAIINSYTNKADLGSLQATSDTLAIDSSALYNDSILNPSDTALQDEVITNQDIVDGINYNEVDNELKALEEKQKSNAESTSNDDGKKSSKLEPKPASKPNEKPKTTIVSGDGGPYLVMAGSYLLRENANKMVKRLKSLGYNKADVIIFTASEYYSVVAVSYQSEEKAKEASAMLKRKGIDSFVKTK